MDAQSKAMLPFNLTIIRTDKNNKRTGKPFVAMFNPENISINETLDWDYGNAAGNDGADPTYVRSRPRSFSIDLVLDGTGINNNGAKTPVTAQVLLFRAVTSNINGSSHRPNYLIVQYGTFVCNCSINSSTVTYTMFDFTGTPIRAKISASFTERTPAALGSIQNRLSSPDLTHVVEIKEWDLLPYLTYNVYNDQRYYLQVARANKLKNFRRLQAGSTLVFPPIASQKS